MRKLVFLFILVFLFGCVSIQYLDKKYDYNFFMIGKEISVIQSIELATYIIEVKGSLSTGSNIIPHKHKAIAFSLDGKHLIVLNHVLQLPKKMFFPPFPLPLSVEEVGKKGIFLDGKELKVLSNDSDIAMLYNEEQEYKILPIKIGNSDELEIGIALVLTRCPAVLGFGISCGIVSNPSGFGVLQEDEGGEDPRHVFMIAAPINQGDSGCPVFALRDGVPELVGIAQGKIHGLEGVGWALKINYVMEQIESLLKLKESE